MTEFEEHYWGMSANTYCMAIHLSQLSSIFGLGLILPILTWIANKDKNDKIDIHGKNQHQLGDQSVDLLHYLLDINPRFHWAVMAIANAKMELTRRYV